MQNEYPPLPSLKIIDTYPEQIIKFAFQLTRKTPSCLILLSNQLKDLLISLKNALFISDENAEIDKYINYYILLYKLIIYTRDIFVGKGERDLTYMMISIWYSQFPILAIYSIKTICEKNYGSWKDIKYLCNYIKENSLKNTEDPIIENCISLINC
jgi:hypothetical protein